MKGKKSIVVTAKKDVLMNKRFIVFLFVFIAQACVPGGQPQNIPAIDISPLPAVTATQSPLLSTNLPAVPDSASLVTDIVVSSSASTITPTPALDFWMDLPVVPSGISDRVREIYQRGLLMGNDPNAFSKIGDCHSVNPFFLSDYDLGPDVYELGKYAYLQPTIDYFGGSFGRTSLAAKKGLSTAGVLAPLWSDWKQCSNNEAPLNCEFRLHRPSFAIVSLGTNEAYDIKQDRTPFEGRLRRIIEQSIDQGVVPILSTKADNEEGDHYINYVTARLAMEYELPLWNFWKAVQPLPHYGMRSPAHLTFAPTNSFTDFSQPAYLEYGMQIRNLTALQVLDVVRLGIAQPQASVTLTPTMPLTITPVDVTYQAGETMISTVDGMTLVYIPAGEFEMGSTSGNFDEAPIHTVSLGAYWMDGTEVTNAMFANFLNIVGNKTEGGVTWLDSNDPWVWVSDKDGSWQAVDGKQNFPVVGVSWYGAKAYCEWAGRQLPTEAQWEYAAKGTEGYRFPWGNEDLDCDRARYLGCGDGPVEVRSLPLGVSPFGIFEMAGNVAEWVNDRYGSDYYEQSPLQDPVGPSNGYYRVVRGGYWENVYLPIKTTQRYWAGADERNGGIGFRCALTP